MKFIVFVILATSLSAKASGHNKLNLPHAISGAMEKLKLTQRWCQWCTPEDNVSPMTGVKIDDPQLNDLLGLNQDLSWFQSADRSLEDAKKDLSQIAEQNGNELPVKWLFGYRHRSIEMVLVDLPDKGYRLDPILVCQEFEEQEIKMIVFDPLGVFPQYIFRETSRKLLRQWEAADGDCHTN